MDATAHTFLCAMGECFLYYGWAFDRLHGRGGCRYRRYVPQALAADAGASDISADCVNQLYPLLRHGTGKSAGAPAVCRFWLGYAASQRTLFLVLGFPILCASADEPAGQYTPLYPPCTLSACPASLSPATE